MLAFTIEAGNKQQDILIGDSIVVQLCWTKGNRARIAVDAPRELKVDRRETRERIQREGERRTA